MNRKGEAMKRTYLFFILFANTMAKALMAGQLGGHSIGIVIDQTLIFFSFQAAGKIVFRL
jgi:hypothetical protein